MKEAFVACALLVVNSFAAGQQTDMKEPKPRTVTVHGLGTVTTAPDQVRLSVQVNTRASSATEAMSQASAKTAEILKSLKSLGVETKDVQTTRVTVNPILDYQRNIQPPPIVGYSGINEFNVVFKGNLMDRVGVFMDKAIAGGATGFGGLQYENSRQRELERDALKKAAVDAQARAEVLAKELGAGVGKALSISESIAGRGPVDRFVPQNLEAAASTPVMMGELIINAQIDVVFELK